MSRLLSFLLLCIGAYSAGPAGLQPNSLLSPIARKDSRALVETGSKKFNLESTLYAGSCMQFDFTLFAAVKVSVAFAGTVSLTVGSKGNTLTLSSMVGFGVGAGIGPFSASLYGQLTLAIEATVPKQWTKPWEAAANLVKYLVGALYHDWASPKGSSAEKISAIGKELRDKLKKDKITQYDDKAFDLAYQDLRVANLAFIKKVLADVEKMKTPPKDYKTWQKKLYNHYRETFLPTTGNVFSKWPDCAKFRKPLAGKWDKPRWGLALMCEAMRYGVYLPGDKVQNSVFHEGHSSNILNSLPIVFEELFPAQDLAANEFKAAMQDQMDNLLLLKDLSDEELGMVIDDWSSAPYLTGICMDPSLLGEFLKATAALAAKFFSEEIKLVKVTLTSDIGFTLGSSAVGFCTPDTNFFQVIKTTKKTLVDGKFKKDGYVWSVVMLGSPYFFIMFQRGMNDKTKVNSFQVSLRFPETIPGTVTNEDPPNMIPIGQWFGGIFNKAMDVSPGGKAMKAFLEGVVKNFATLLSKLSEVVGGGIKTAMTNLAKTGFGKALTKMTGAIFAKAMPACVDQQKEWGFDIVLEKEGSTKTGKIALTTLNYFSATAHAPVVPWLDIRGTFYILTGFKHELSFTPT